MKLLGFIFALAIITIVGATYSDIVLTSGEPAAEGGDAVAAMIARGSAKTAVLPFTHG
jgi:hypothetical protein